MLNSIAIYCPPISKPDSFFGLGMGDATLYGLFDAETGFQGCVFHHHFGLGIINSGAQAIRAALENDSTQNVGSRPEFCILVDVPQDDFSNTRAWLIPAN